MSKVEQIEHDILQLNETERRTLRAWFAEVDGAAWDEQIEADAQSGRLDRLAERALRDYHAGQSTPLE